MRRGTATAARLLALAAISLTTLAAPADLPAGPFAVAPPAGVDWAASATTYRGQNGKRLEYICPADGQPATIYGTDVYTDDSSICTAAVHDGKLTTADGGTVTIEIRPGQNSYTSTTRNGVTSTAFGQWSGSFVVVAAEKGGGKAGVKMGGGGWDAEANEHRGHNGVQYLYICPSGGKISPRLWGTNVYTDDSSVCSAAAQVGVITPAAGGNVTIELRPGQKSYVGFTHNGVTSRAYPAWTGSFVMAGAPPIPGSPSGSGGSGGSGGGGGGGGGGGTTTTGGGTAAAPPTATTTGTVTVNGQPFTTGTIPFGATVDVTRGAVVLASNVGTLKVTGAGGITAAFTLARGTDRGKPVVELRLAKGDFSKCRKPRGTRATATIVRQVWGDGKGRFRTKGRYASATVRGTRWLTADRCDGTFVRVQRGVIAVNDVPNRRQVTLRAGRSYLARP